MAAYLLAAYLSHRHRLQDCECILVTSEGLWMMILSQATDNGSNFESGASLQTAGSVSAIIGGFSEWWVHRAENPSIGAH
jgi:hypothetical protein